MAETYEAQLIPILARHSIAFKRLHVDVPANGMCYLSAIAHALSRSIGEVQREYEAMTHELGIPIWMRVNKYTAPWLVERLSPKCGVIQFINETDCVRSRHVPLTPEVELVAYSNVDSDRHASVACFVVSEYKCPLWPPLDGKSHADPLEISGELLLPVTRARDIMNRALQINDLWSCETGSVRRVFAAPNGIVYNETTISSQVESMQILRKRVPPEPCSHRQSSSPKPGPQ